jgi:AcrR family transcriptional regulator
VAGGGAGALSAADVDGSRQSLPHGHAKTDEEVELAVTSVRIVTSSACHRAARFAAKSARTLAGLVAQRYVTSVTILTERFSVIPLLTKKQQQGENSRELILDATEKLMATRGYAATSISDIRKACGLPPSSIYWHFGSKEGVLASVMERGAERFFAAIPSGGTAEQQLTVLADLQSQHPDFLRLFYMLSLERSDDAAVARIVRRVRDNAIDRFRDAIRQLLPGDVGRAKAQRIVAELTAFAVAQSDGIFLADHLEPDSTDVHRSYRRLFQAIAALIPILLEDK